MEDMEDMEDMVEAVEARTWLKKKKASLPNALIMHFSSGSFRSARPPALNAECWMMMNPSCAESLLRVGCIACVSVCLRRRVFAPMPSAWEKPKPKHWGEKPLSDHQIEAKKSQDQPPVCDLFIRKTSANWGLRKSLSDSRKKVASKFAEC
jgi:hypothetical protein